MSDPQIISYIKDQLAQGVQKDAISAALKANGWSDQDVAEAFQAAMPVSTPQASAPSPSGVSQVIQSGAVVAKKNSGMLTVVIIAIIVLASAGGYVVYDKKFTKIQNTPNSPDTVSPQTGEIISEKTCSEKATEYERNDCYVELAGVTGDTSVCPNITSANIADSCIISAQDVKKDIGLCEQVKSPGTKNICYGRVAYLTANLSYCDKITERPNPYGGIKDLCYGNVAGQLKDASICEKISLNWESEDMEKPPQYQGGRVYCYQQIAKTTGDIGICSKINSEYEYEKQKCIRGE